MIQAIIIEDEPLAAQRLKELLAEVTQLIQIQKIIRNVEDAVSYLQLHNPELIFLDINLFERYSFEIFELVEVRSRIIFTTAYSEFAIKAFEQNSIDYLLKPISRESLNKSIQKFFTLKRDDNSKYDSIVRSELLYREKFLVRQGNSLSVIPTRDIAFFFSEDKCTFLMTHDGRRFHLETTLTELESSLHPKQFFRVNRKYIIHSEAIQSMGYLSKSKLKLILRPHPSTGELITVAIEKMGSFKRWLGG